MLRNEGHPLDCLNVYPCIFCAWCRKAPQDSGAAGSGFEVLELPLRKGGEESEEAVIVVAFIAVPFAWVGLHCALGWAGVIAAAVLSSAISTSQEP